MVSFHLLNCSMHIRFKSLESVLFFINTLIQQGLVKLINVATKTFTLIQNISISNKYTFKESEN